MLIKLLEDVSSSFTKTAKGGYTTAQVVYQNERGEKKEWKVLSFSNPKVFDTLKEAKAGENYEITTGKNDKDFTVWTAASLASATATSPTPSGVQKTTTSTYETAAERAVKQRLIVRQSSLSNALEYFKVRAEPGLSREELFNVADEFAAWVYESPKLFDKPNDFPEGDIPF